MNDQTADVRPITAADLPLFSDRELAFATANVQLSAAGAYSFVGAFAADGCLMGYVALDSRPETDLAPEMKSLWVYPQYRRRGLGVQLTRYIERIASDQGFTSVKLGVDPENPAAIPMYIRLEYTPTGDHRMVPDADGVEQHEAIYRKSLAITR